MFLTRTFYVLTMMVILPRCPAMGQYISFPPGAFADYQFTLTAPGKKEEVKLQLKCLGRDKKDSDLLRVAGVVSDEKGTGLVPTVFFIEASSSRGQKLPLPYFKFQDGEDDVLGILVGQIVFFQHIITREPASPKPIEVDIEGLGKIVCTERKGNLSLEDLSQRAPVIFNLPKGLKLPIDDIPLTERKRKVPCRLLLHPWVPFGVVRVEFGGMTIALSRLSPNLKWYQDHVSEGSNYEIISLAKWLDNWLLQSDATLTQHRKDTIASLLIRFHATLDDRIKQSPRGADGLPIVKDIQWNKADPLAGIVEGLSPFHMIDWWVLVAERKDTEQMRSSVQILPRIHKDPPVATLNKREGVVIENGPIQIEHMSFNRFLTRAVQALQKRPASRHRDNMIRILKQMQKRNVDDRYVSFRVQGLVFANKNIQAIKQLYPSKLPRLRDHLQYHMERYSIGSDSTLAIRLENWHFADIENAFKLIQLHVATQGVASDPGQVLLSEWLANQVKNPNSIYYQYAPDRTFP